MTGAPLAVTMGDPAGIGGDIALKAWLCRDALLPTFFLIDDPARLAKLAARLGLDVPLAEIASAAECGSVFARALPVLPQPLSAPAIPGHPDPANAPTVAESIALAARLAARGEVAAMVTNPISKEVMHAGGFEFPGHTEFLAHLAGCRGEEVMMLACPGLKVVPVTIHVSLAEAARSLTSRAIIAAGRATARALVRDFAIPHPRLAVAALNPHAGEGGAMGNEESTIIDPAVAALRALGIDTFGPLPADTLFHAEARRNYDAVLCMYHDQALIPLKTIDFDNGVNITLGLPFVRTSPDHGTAFDLAGSGRASDASLVAALRLAETIAANRRRFDGG